MTVRFETRRALAAVPAGAGAVARRVQAWLLPAAIAALGIVLRLSLLSGFRLHPDEALYATWARYIATGQDPLLAEHLVDKPPLFIYLLASLFTTLGASEEIARLPNELAGAVALLLVYGIGLELYRSRRVALLAMLVLALSPLSILFAPTAFTDPLMATLLLAVVWCSLRGRWLSAGVAYGLALATKQDAVLFAPVALLLLAVRRDVAGPSLPGSEIDGGGPRGRSTPVRALRVAGPIYWRDSARRVAGFAAGLAGPMLMVGIWSALRPQPDFLQASLANYGGLNLAPPEQYLSRALEWLPLLRTITSDWLALATLAVLPMLLFRERRRSDWVLLSVAAGWLALHVVLIFPAWDRYMLPLAPVCALLMAGALVWLYDHLPVGSAKLAALALAALLLALPVRAALRDEIQVGRDFNLHAGVDQVGLWFWQIDTTATILYDHDLSWELDYYTFGRGLDRRWFADGAQLAPDAAHMPLARRFVVVAEWESLYPDLEQALATENLMLVPVFVARRPDGSEAVTVYLIAPPTAQGIAPMRDAVQGYR